MRNAAGLWLLVLGFPAAAGEARFAAKPSAVKAGDGAKIAFAVSEPTDVEVAVLGADGKVVRHLAAGLLGPNAPAPLRKGSLSQEVPWDGKDDCGKPAAGGAFKVRVRMGMRPGAAKVVPVSFPGEKSALKVGPGQKWDFGAAAGPGIGWNCARTEMSIKGLMLSADHVSGRLHVRRFNSPRWVSLDPETGAGQEVKGLRDYTHEIFFGVDGLVYPMQWGWVTRRFDREWKPAPFAGTGDPGIAKPTLPAMNSPEYDELGFGAARGRESACVGLDGKLYLFCALPDTGYARLFVWGRDGKLEKSGQVPFVKTRAGTGIRVDRDGFLYVAVNGVPAGHEFPAGLGEDAKTHVGSVVKIALPEKWAEKPADGARAAGPGLTLAAWLSTAGGHKAQDLAVPGAVAAAPGISPVMPMGLCTCSHPRFDMDPFGRLYLPDAMSGAVRVCDANGSHLAAARGKVGDVEIGSPVRVACAGDAVFFWDYGKGQLVRLQLGWAAESTCGL